MEEKQGSGFNHLPSLHFRLLEPALYVVATSLLDSFLLFQQNYSAGLTLSSTKLCKLALMLSPSSAVLPNPSFGNEGSQAT